LNKRQKYEMGETNKAVNEFQRTGLNTSRYQIRLMFNGEHPIATMPLKVLFSQHTDCCVHVPLPTPKVWRGEQVKPTATPGATAISRSLRSSLVAPESAEVTELQHWTDPPLQELLMLAEGLCFLAPYVGVPRRTGAAGW